jgi:hypothetical protein
LFILAAVDSTGQCNTLCFNYRFGEIGYGTTRQIGHDECPEVRTLAALAQWRVDHRH